MFLRTFIQDYNYKICFDHPADLLYRQHNSLSRHGYFTRAKIESRCKVIRNAVSLLETSGKSELRHLGRFIVADTVHDAIRVRLHGLASDIMMWALQHRVITRAEATILKRTHLAYRTRMARFSPVRRWIESQLSVFSATSFRGQLPDSEPLVQHCRKSVC